MSELANVEIGLIRENPEAIRVVNRQTESYIGIVDSIKEKGFIGAITVRPFIEDGVTYYVVVDGMHRYMAAKDAGLDSIPCSVCNLDESSAIEVSIMANVHRKDTAASEYRAGLRAILQLHPMMTVADLAVKLGKSATWINNIMQLNNIESTEIMALVDDGSIVMSNAYALAKLPADDQVNYLTDAQTMAPEEFLPKVTERVKEIKEAKRRGDDPSAAAFSPAEFMQKMTLIKEVRENGEMADALISETGVTTAKEGFILALNWTLHADAFSIADQKAKFDQREAAKTEKKRQKDAEKAAKAKLKAEENLKKAAEVEATIAQANVLV